MHQDIFDRIMAWKIFSPIRPFYQKYKEILLYLFFGGLTFSFNIGCYVLCARGFHWNPLLSNIVAWVAGVLFAYVTNHIWVFRSAVRKATAILKELFTFSAGRLVTLSMEEVMLWMGIDLLNVNDLAIKLIAQIAVIIGNYMISKWVVFKHKQ